MSPWETQLQTLGELNPVRKKPSTRGLMSAWEIQLQGLSKSSSARAKNLTRARADEAKRMPRLIKQVESEAPFVTDVLSLFKGDEQLSTKHIAAECGVNRTTALKWMWALEAAGRVIRISASAQTRWAISSRP